jgi:lysophospholipase L1-like esterase
MLRKSMGPILAACLVFTACQDATDPVPTSPIVGQNNSEGRGFAHRLYVVGTSISAGTCSDGNISVCQNTSYVADIVRFMNRQPTLPLIGGTGCKAPFASPIISFKRISGESVAAPDASLACAANEPGVVLPTQNLAVPGALTGDALTKRPEDVTDAYASQLYRRILPQGSTQVSALIAQNPKFVIVELGANDILGIHSGVVIAGASFVPFNVWSAQYNAVLDQVGTVTKQALLVGLGRDISKLSSLRRGYELWADRAAFLSAFNVDVNANCDANQNLLVVPAIIPAAVAQGLGRRAAGAPPFVLSCAEGASNVQDRVLTPAEAAIVDAQLVLMSDHVRGRATARGYAFMELEALYGLPKPAFSVVAFMTTGTPYGPNISLDGLHPSAAGHTILAQAAIRAIDDRYNVGFDGSFFGVSSSPSVRTP